MKGILTITLFMISTLFITISADSADLDNLIVKPGQWNFTVTVDMSKSKDQFVQSRTTCFKESKMDPFESFNVSNNETGCSMNNVIGENGKSIEWRWFCEENQNSPKTNGKGKYISTGTEINGSIKTTYFQNGTLLSTNVLIQGEYVGECASESEEKRENLLTKKSS
ncbi:MAG: DUF3617 domain-containing protein [Thermodesulfobacteriota bacterium]